MSEETEQYLTFTEAADYLGISLVTLRERVKKGWLTPKVNPLDTRQKLIAASELINLLTQQGIKLADTAPILERKRTTRTQNKGKETEAVGTERVNREQPTPKIAPSPSETAPARASNNRRQQKKAGAPALRWFVAVGEAGAVRVLGPFETSEDARETQAVLVGKSKLYQAERKGLAEAEYLEFLRKVATGRDSW